MQHNHEFTTSQSVFHLISRDMFSPYSTMEEIGTTLARSRFHVQNINEAFRSTAIWS